MCEWPKLFESIKTKFKFGGNQSQSIKGSNNVVASQSKGGSANSMLMAQVVVERHGYARTPTDLFGDFDHAIRNYHKLYETNPSNPPALLVTDWDIMIIQMLFRDNDLLKDRLKIINGVISYNEIPLKHPTAGILRMTDQTKMNSND